MGGTPNVTLKKSHHKGWDAWQLQCGPLGLILVPQVGGRIMGMLWRGHNLSFTQPEREGQVADLSRIRDVRARKREMGFPLWGGDKTWLAPLPFVGIAVILVGISFAVHTILQVIRFQGQRIRELALAGAEKK